jgi:hypothetical protein
VIHLTTAARSIYIDQSNETDIASSGVIMPISGIEPCVASQKEHL